ncbi:MAG: LPS assembly lipoprotein LptE [Putridiphycobacter sp.]
MRFVLYILLVFSLHSCFTYSFVDGSIDAETFSVAIFEEQAANAPAGYGGAFTDYLKDFIIGRSKLKLKDLDADIQINGRIVSYNTAPLAVQANESAALSRLTVTMAVGVINNVKPEESFEKNFSQFSDFDSSTELSLVEDELLEDINNKIAQDIINKLSSNW